MDIQAVIAAGKEWRNLWDEPRARPNGHRDAYYIFRLAERFACCTPYTGYLECPDRELIHGSSLSHIAIKHGVPTWVVFESLQSIEDGNGVPPAVIAEYAARRLTGSEVQDGY